MTPKMNDELKRAAEQHYLEKRAKYYECIDSEISMDSFIAGSNHSSERVRELEEQNKALKDDLKWALHQISHFRINTDEDTERADDKMKRHYL